MSHLRGQVVSFLFFWAFTVLLVSLLFLRGKGAGPQQSDAALAPPPEISSEAVSLAAIAEPTLAVAGTGSSIRKRFSRAERLGIRHAVINVPQ
jgi:hypothetical protein